MAFEASANPTGSTRRDRAEPPAAGTRKMSRDEVLGAELFDELPREGETVTEPAGVPEIPNWVGEVQAVVDAPDAPLDDWEDEGPVGVPWRDKAVLGAALAALVGGLGYLATRPNAPPPPPPPVVAAAPAPEPAPVAPPPPAPAPAPSPIAAAADEPKPAPPREAPAAKKKIAHAKPVKKAKKHKR